MATLSSAVASATIFQTARNELEREIGDLILCLNEKKVELLKEINKLEREFGYEQQQQQQQRKELDRLKTLKSQAEQLSQDNRQEVVSVLQQKINKLTLDSKQEPNYKIGIKWGFAKTSVIRCVNSSNIELTTDTTADEYTLFDCLVLSDGTGSSSEELNTELMIQPADNSDSDPPAPGVYRGFTDAKRISPEDIVTGATGEKPNRQRSSRPRVRDSRKPRSYQSHQRPYQSNYADGGNYRQRFDREARDEPGVRSDRGGFRPRRGYGGPRRNNPRTRRERGRFRNSPRRNDSVSD